MSETIRVICLLSSLAALGAPTVATADDPTLVGVPGRSAAFERCVELAQPAPTGSMWPGFSVCQTKELARLNRRLNGDYQALKRQSRLYAKGATGLVDAERGWVSFRDKWCEFERRNGPTAEYVTRLNCQLDLTLEQLSRIDDELSPSSPAAANSAALVGAPGRSAAFWRCVESAQGSAASGWPGYAACQKRELAQLNVRLDGEYQELLLQVRSHNSNEYVLGDSQKSWMAFRDRWCGFEDLRSSVPKYVTHLSCELDRTEEQLSHIADQIETVAHSHT